MESFLTNVNMNLLWEVIIDEDILKSRSKDVIDIVHEMFQTNINSFYNIEKRKSTSLIELNKKYIMLILNYVNNIILRSNKAKDEPHTHDDIQKDRRSQFDQELTIKQQEFTTSMTVPVPNTPIFNDNLDQPLSDIEKDIKKLTEQRKYDIDQINNNYNKADDWLKPKETSIKGEKIQSNDTVKCNQPIDSKIKYIKIDKETIVDDSKNIIDLQTNIKRHISWNDIQCETNNDTINNHVVDINELNISVNELKHDLKEMNNKIEKMNTSIEDFLKLLQIDNRTYP
jgi:hypothetical protein